MEAAHRAGEEEGRYNPHIVKLVPGNPSPRTQAFNPVLVTCSTKDLILIISCTDGPGCEVDVWRHCKIPENPNLVFSLDVYSTVAIA